MEQTLRNKCDDKSNDLMEQMKKFRYSDPDLVLELGKELLLSGKQNQDSYLKAFAFLYICDAYYSLRKCNQAIDYGRKGLCIQKQNHYHELLIQQYNLLGLVYTNQDQEYYAIDCFNKGLEVAKKTNNVKMIGFITNNIGIIYVKLKDYEKAIEYYTLGYHETKNCNNRDVVGIQEEAWNLNLTDAYISWGKTKQAQEQLDMAKKILAKSKVDKEEVLVNGLQMSIYYQQGRYEESFENARRSMELIRESQYYLRYYPAAIEILNILIRIYRENREQPLGIEALSYAREWKDKCYEIAKLIQLPENWLMYYDAVIDLYQQLHEMEALTEALLEHRKWMSEQNENIRKSRLGGIQNQIELGKLAEEKQKMEQMNEKLQILSEVDQLTGAKNRYALNEYMEKVISDGIKEQRMLGLFLLDVDYFKEFNDTYGHIAGDECLAKVAKTIIAIIGDNGLVVRYGGDEFLIILNGKTTEQIKEYAKQIREEIIKLNIPHNESLIADYVTVSQGGINCIPEENMSISDYINNADVALYKVKKSARNNYYISERFL